MFSFQRFVLASLAALGLLGASAQTAHAWGISVEAWTEYPVPSPGNPGDMAVVFGVSIDVAAGWYFGGLNFTGLATRSGRSLNWEYAGRSDLWDQLFELEITNQGGSAWGYFGEAVINAKTAAGVYDRDPRNLRLPAVVTVYAYNDEGDYDSAQAGLRVQVSGPIVPEPASAFLLGVGLMIPAGAVWLRRRQAA